MNCECVTLHFLIEAVPKFPQNYSMSYIQDTAPAIWQIDMNIVDKYTQNLALLAFHPQYTKATKERQRETIFVRLLKARVSHVGRETLVTNSLCETPHSTLDVLGEYPVVVSELSPNVRTSL